MAILTLSAQIKELSKYPTLQPAANSLDIAFTAPSVAVDGIDFECTGREVVFVQNTDVGAQSFSLISVADSLGRTGDITTYSLGAGEFAAILVPQVGFRGASGRALITMSNVAVKVAVVRVPNIL